MLISILFQSLIVLTSNVLPPSVMRLYIEGIIDLPCKNVSFAGYKYQSSSSDQERINVFGAVIRDIYTFINNGASSNKLLISKRYPI